MKPPPNSNDDEQAVLGAMLVDPTVIPAVKAIIGPDDFYTGANRIIAER